MLSHMNATLQGLATVRTCNATVALEKEFHEFQNRNISTWYLYTCASRSFALYTDLLSLVFITVILYGFLLFGNGKFNFKLFL